MIYFKAIKELIKRCEANRVNHLFAKREVEAERERIKKMEAQNKSLESQLRSARRGYAKELKKQKAIKTEIKVMSTQLKAIKEFVESQPSTTDMADTVSEHVLSRITEVDTLLEGDQANGKTEDSLDGTLFDQSEENIADTNVQ